MAKRVLAIGVGGSGKAALTIMKERLEETYGQVPDNVVLLSLDTDSLRDADSFAGTQLTNAVDERKRLPEYQHIVSPGGMTMDTVFADIRSGKTSAFMNWLEHEKLDRMLGPAERDIRGGAQQRRPIGRTGLFLRYANPIFQSLKDAIAKMYGDPEKDKPANIKDAADVEKGKRLIFIVGSVAGGTGSGMLLDIANLVRAAISGNQNWQSVSVSAVIVLPDAFATYTRFMEDPSNLKPNSYAALREFDRFMRVHSSFQPYMIRYADSEQSITWSTNQLVDHVYLVDTASRSASQDFDLSGNPIKGVFPAVADFMMAHVDNSLGDALATLRSNAGQNYEKPSGRVYSGFNVMSYIFPVDDVIETFSYRFVRELLAREFLPITDQKRVGSLNSEAITEVEKSFTATTVANHANPTVIQKSIVATKRVDPEPVDTSWGGLFSLISLSDSGFAEDYQTLQQSLDYLQGNLVLTKEGDYRKENFEEGAERLRGFTEQFLDDYLGAQQEPDDPESRIGGDWDAILGRYRDAVRLRFAEALDAALLDALNRRDERKALLPNRLPYAKLILADLKAHLTKFKTKLEASWYDLKIETQLRQSGEGVRNALAWMNDSRYKRYLPPFATEPRQAQESFRGQFVDRMNLALHQRVYRTVLDVLDSLGAAEKDAAGQTSVLDTALLELESWERTLQDVDRILGDQWRQHEANRAEKNTVKVRNYLTDKAFEDTLYRQPEHFGMVAARIMGQVGDQKGLQWQRLDELEPLDYKLYSTWGEEAKGAEKIARTWFAGAKGLFQAVRKSVTIAERLATEFPNSSTFVNKALQVEEPFLRYNPSLNRFTPVQERYISFNVKKARTDEARTFLGDALGALDKSGLTLDASAESVVACTVVEIARGFRLEAVEPFRQCEPEYRTKLSKGHESIHLFSEEQNATDLEQSIPTLGETDNAQRVLAPELTIAMGDSAKLSAFTMACAYGLIYEDVYRDPKSNRESTELWLRLSEQRRVPLSQSNIVRALDQTFSNLPPTEQSARLYLNALQNFVLKLVEPPGFDLNMIQRVKGELEARGVPLQGIENPFTLKLSEVYGAINGRADNLGPSTTDVTNPMERRSANATRRLEVLRPYLENNVQSFKRSVYQPVRDMGTVMHLILREEIGNQTKYA